MFDLKLYQKVPNQEDGFGLASGVLTLFFFFLWRNVLYMALLFENQRWKGDLGYRKGL